MRPFADRDGRWHAFCTRRSNVPVCLLHQQFLYWGSCWQWSLARFHCLTHFSFLLIIVFDVCLIRMVNTPALSLLPFFSLVYQTLLKKISNQTNETLNCRRRRCPCLDDLNQRITTIFFVAHILDPTTADVLMNHFQQPQIETLCVCVCVCVWTKHYLSFFQGHLGLVQLTHFYVRRLARQTTRLIEGFRHHLVFIFFKTLFYLTHCVHIHSVVIRFDHLYPCAIIFLSLNQKKNVLNLIH